jgi:hypothetical protein
MVWIQSHSASTLLAICITFAPESQHENHLLMTNSVREIQVFSETFSEFLWVLDPTAGVCTTVVGLAKRPLGVWWLYRSIALNSATVCTHLRKFGSF